MNIKRLLLVPLACAGVSACAPYWGADVGRFDPEDFGEANRQTYAAMIEDPDPQYDEPLTANAERGADAVEAYREGSVAEPESTGVGGGGI